MRREQLKRAANFPSDDESYAQSSPVPTLGHSGPDAKPPPPRIAESFDLTVSCEIILSHMKSF